MSVYVRMRPSGKPRYIAEDRDSTSGRMPMSQSAARRTSDVGVAAPATQPSAWPSATSPAPKRSGSHAEGRVRARRPAPLRGRRSRRRVAMAGEASVAGGGRCLLRRSGSVRRCRDGRAWPLPRQISSAHFPRGRRFAAFVGPLPERARGPGSSSAKSPRQRIAHGGMHQAVEVAAEAGDLTHQR